MKGAGRQVLKMLVPGVYSLANRLPAVCRSFLLNLNQKVNDCIFLNVELFCEAEPLLIFPTNCYETPVLLSAALGQMLHTFSSTCTISICCFTSTVRLYKYTPVCQSERWVLFRIRISKLKANLEIRKKKLDPE